MACGPRRPRAFGRGPRAFRRGPLIARMRPKFIVRAWEALQQVASDDRASHWLNTIVDGRGRGRRRPLWEANPYLLVGGSAWDTDTACFPAPSMTRYGRVGAPGSPWWIAIRGSDTDGEDGDEGDAEVGIV